MNQNLSLIVDTFGRLLLLLMTSTFDQISIKLEDRNI